MPSRYTKYRRIIWIRNNREIVISRLGNGQRTYPYKVRWDFALSDEIIKLRDQGRAFPDFTRWKIWGIDPITGGG
jgi:hypothetical protein